MATRKGSRPVWGSRSTPIHRIVWYRMARSVAAAVATVTSPSVCRMSGGWGSSVSRLGLGVIVDKVAEYSYEVEGGPGWPLVDVRFVGFVFL